MVYTRSQHISQDKVIVNKFYVNENNEMEVAVCKLRNEIVYMKNVNIEKKQIITEKVMNLITEVAVQYKVELEMDLIKFVWKLVLKNFMTLKDFKNEFDNAYKRINCGVIPEWLQIQVVEFRKDFEYLMEIFGPCVFNENFNKVITEIKQVIIYGTSPSHIKTIYKFKELDIVLNQLDHKIQETETYESKCDCECECDQSKARNI